MKIGETFYEPSRVAWVDAVFFDLFTYERVAGDVTRMDAPGSVTLTTSVATRYFERPDEAVGRTIRVGQELMLEVVAVVSDPPTRTHLPFRVMVSYASREDANVYEDWYFTNGHITNGYITYAKLRAGADAGADAGAVTRRLNAVRSERQEAENRDVTRFYLQPVTTPHTDSNGTNAYPGATVMPPGSGEVAVAGFLPAFSYRLCAFWRHLVGLVAKGHGFVAKDRMGSRCGNPAVGISDVDAPRRVHRVRSSFASAKAVVRIAGVKNALSKV